MRLYLPAYIPLLAPLPLPSLLSLHFLFPPLSTFTLYTPQGRDLSDLLFETIFIDYAIVMQWLSITKVLRWDKDSVSPNSQNGGAQLEGAWPGVLWSSDTSITGDCDSLSPGAAQLLAILNRDMAKG